MAEDKKLVEAITSMDVDFAQWYTDVCKKAELMSYSSVKGCMIFKPAGYAIWENIKNEMDRRFKETGVENVYLPMFIPESLLEKVLEGFDIEINDTLPTQFHCNCCRERVEKALISIGRKELNEMIQEGKSIEMNCHFCNKNYEFTVEELKEILRKCK